MGERDAATTRAEAAEAEIGRLRAILADEKELMRVIREELEQVRLAYAEPRLFTQKVMSVKKTKTSKLMAT